VTRKSDVAPTRSIWNAANNQAGSWTIGSKPNANSKAECCGGYRRARRVEPSDSSATFLGEAASGLVLRAGAES
jgi:hypothetical protein